MVCKSRGVAGLGRVLSMQKRLVWGRSLPLEATSPPKGFKQGVNTSIGGEKGAGRGLGGWREAVAAARELDGEGWSQW